MPSYDFSTLSPYDFEIITRDLLQELFRFRLESFKTGKDNGIDFRYAQGEHETIIQCKHYIGSGLRMLISNLKIEALKVKQLRPNRYVVVTSVQLSPANKKEIATIIGRKFVREADVFGQDDLNNLLALYPRVEEAHFKLWLASRTVFDRVLHNATVTQSSFRVKQVYENLPRYVQNDAYPKAMNVLAQDRIVIISGPPGIGKTTLADLLLYRHVELGFQAIEITDSLEEGRSILQEGQPQVFYFDDFMGRTYLGDRTASFNRQEGDAIVGFIQLVKASPNARLILTTREHILSQAIERSERIRHSNVLDYRVVIQLEDYSLIQRAKILYNHIYFNKLTIPIKLELLKDEFYLDIVKHEKFNPRLIDWLSSYDRIKSIQAVQYRSFVNGLLENPSEIWRHAYEQEISEAGRSLLLTLFTLQGHANEDALRQAFSDTHVARAQKYNFERKANDYRTAISELKGAFVKPTGKDYINFINPSILDWLNLLIREVPEIAVDLVSSSSNVDQISQICIFSLSSKESDVVDALRKEIDSLIPAFSRCFQAERRKNFGNGRIRAMGRTYERRLSVLVAIIDKLQTDALLPLVTSLTSFMIKDWEAHAIDVVDLIDLTETLDRARWMPLQRMTELRDICIERLVVEAQDGCDIAHLRRIIDLLGDRVEDEPEISDVMRLAFEVSVSSHFDDELQGCRAPEEFDELSDNIRHLEAVLNINTLSLLSNVSNALERLGEGIDEVSISTQDDWTESEGDSRDVEATIKHMFGSLYNTNGG